MPRLNYLQKSKIKQSLNEKGLRVSGAYIEALDREVAALLDKHARIAKQDGRVTVMVVDISLSQKIASLSRSLR